MSSELDDLRGNVGQIMEMLQVIRAKLDTQETAISEVSGPTLEPQPARTLPTTWPPYGLLPGFTPSFEGAQVLCNSCNKRYIYPSPPRRIMWSILSLHQLSTHMCNHILKLIIRYNMLLNLMMKRMKCMRI